MKTVKNKKNWRLIMVFMASALMSIFIIYKIIFLQYFSDDLSKEGDRYTVILDAKRGNILSDNGKVLAATVPTYDIYVDFHTINPELFETKSESLIKSLNKLFIDREANKFQDIIRNSKLDCTSDDSCANNCSRYIPLIKDVSHEELQILKSFPIFNKGRNQGGLIPELRSARSSLFGELAKVTLGRFKKDNITPHNGIELNFNQYLKGEQGLQVYYRGIPVKSDLNMPSTTGKDVVTTININLQDAVEDALRSKLEEKQARWGTAVLMEVSTGKVKAIANLHKVPETNNRYTDSKNHAIVSAIPPGSTFKLATLISLITDGYSVSDTIDTEDGSYEFTNLDYSLNDTKRGGYGEITLGEVFVKSSNIGFAKSVYYLYRNNNKKFVDNLEVMGLTTPLDIQLAYQNNMLVKTVDREDWWGSTLPAMSIGYEMRLSPLHILTFYNAFANNGKMLTPQFVSHIEEKGEVVKLFNVDVIKSRICSQDIIDSIMPYMVDVIDKGTARKIKTDKYSIAGKTGTCELRFWKKDSLKSYSSSFVGFFPAHEPKYSCIVVIHDFTDASDKSHYGGDVAAPVFRQISDKVYALDRSLSYRNNQESIINQKNFTVNKDLFDEDLDHIHRVRDKIISAGIQSITVSDLRLMELMDVIFLLENEGLEVKFNGVGKEIMDYKLIDNSIVEIKLS